MDSVHPHLRPSPFSRASHDSNKTGNRERLSRTNAERQASFPRRRLYGKNEVLVGHPVLDSVRLTQCITTTGHTKLFDAVQSCSCCHPTRYESKPRKRVLHFNCPGNATREPEEIWLPKPLECAWLCALQQPTAEILGNFFINMRRLHCPTYASPTPKRWTYELYLKKQPGGITYS